MAIIVKICGITTVEDALAAIDAGADWLGFNFYKKSPRYLDPRIAQTILEEIPSSLTKVGIFVNEPAQQVLDLAVELGLDLLQFHGDESAEYCNAFARPWYRAFRLKTDFDLATLADYHAEYHLVDAHVEKAFGGTGVLADWQLARDVKQYGRLILSGGLRPDNILQALCETRPDGVDVASGVESAPGIKDHRKMEEFIRTVKEFSLKPHAI